MKLGKNCLQVIFILAISLVCSGSQAEKFYIVPFDVDPPIQIDAGLDDWMNIPNPIRMQSEEHVTYRIVPWNGPEDLSAVVRLAWREGLYLAAEVTDDDVRQPFPGRGMYKADYIDLWLDTKPNFEVDRILPGDGQIHIGISPGNFRGSAGGDGTIDPYCVVFTPEGIDATSTKVAARRSEKGYVLEAFIPFAVMGTAKPRPNTFWRFEILASDSDTTPSQQQKLVSVGTAKWETLRRRFLPIVFGDGNGEAVLPVSSTEIVKEAVLSGGKQQTFTFTLDEVPADRDAFLFFNGRSYNPASQSPEPVGYCTEALRVKINGNSLEEDYLTNRPATGMMRDGRMQKTITPDGRITVPAAPDFTSTDQHKSYAIADQKTSEFEFILTGFLKTGENTLTFSPRSRPIVSGVKKILPDIVVGNVSIRTQPKTARSGLLAPAPTGELPVYEPVTTFPSTYTDLKTNTNEIHFQVGDEAYSVESRFSCPDGKWNTGSTRFFSHSRKVKPCKEWIIVYDTFTNLTGENLPLMQSHRSPLGPKAKGVWLQGLKADLRSGRKASPANPSVMAVTRASGLGLLAQNDEFRVHIEQSVENGNVAISDRSFVLKPGDTYTAEWAIVPVTKPDFWRIVNTCRRLLEVNFTLKYTFAFMLSRPPVYEWSDEKFRKFVDNKSADLLVQTNEGVPTKDGHPSRGTDWLAGPHTEYEDFQERVRRLYPDGSKKTGNYFDCFLATHEPNNKRFAADRGLDANGQHVKYGEGKNYRYMKLFVPTLDNGWGKEIEKVIDVSLDTIGVDGIFWDEFSYSTVAYIYSDLMWDGCSADIDPDTFKIKRLKGSLALLSLAFRERQVKTILQRGAPLVINGSPHTRTLARYKMMGFAETGNISHLSTMLLYAPVALGDHITERTGKDAYRTMLRALDGGCLYAWYSTFIIPKHKMLTEHMYPFTPIELHGGYVIGRERILTSRSGLFGWSDKSDFKAYVYDREGRETDKYPVNSVSRNGNTCAEVRMPGGYACAIVRQEH